MVWESKRALARPLTAAVLTSAPSRFPTLESRSTDQKPWPNSPFRRTPRSPRASTSPRRPARRTCAASRSTAGTRTTRHNPRVDTYEVDLDSCGPMVLDALIKIKNEIDPTLTFRRSCREGICGSCAMNIDGTNTLACTKAIDDCGGKQVPIYPLPHMPVVKDLVPDLTHFYAQYAVHRAVAAHAVAPPPASASACSPRKTAPSWTASTSASSAPAARTSCPSYWWNGDRYLGPARPAAGLPLDRRLARRGHRRAAGRPGRSVPALSLPHHHELRADLPEGPESRPRRSPRSRS